MQGLSIWGYQGKWIYICKTLPTEVWLNFYGQSHLNEVFLSFRAKMCYKNEAHFSVEWARPRKYDWNRSAFKLVQLTSY